MHKLSFILVLALLGCGAHPSPLSPTPPGETADLGSTGGTTEHPDLATPASGHDLATHLHDLAAEPPDLAKPPPPTKKVLAFVWEGEQQYYMCGPSAARMALSTRMANPPSQQQLAAYMGTTTNGTDYIGLVRGALDHYLNTTYDETDLSTDPPTQAQQNALKQQLVASIDAGFGLVANVVSGWRPPFYPQGGTIYHYIALVGYDASGDKVMVADPAATGCGDGLCGNPSSSWYNTPKSYWINTSDLGVWIVPKGYTWHP